MMTKTFSEKQLELRYLAMERRRDGVAKLAKDTRFSSTARMAIARAADAMTDALVAIQNEPKA